MLSSTANAFGRRHLFSYNGKLRASKDIAVTAPNVRLLDVDNRSTVIARFVQEETEVQETSVPWFMITVTYREHRGARRARREE